MADAPDFVLLIQIAITLDQEAVPPSAVTRKAIVRLARLESTSETYQTVVSYTVPTGKTFELGGLEIAPENYTVTQIRVTIAGVTQISDQYLQTTFNPRFEGALLSAGQVVLIEAKSDDGSATIVDGAIEGQEIG